MTGSWYIHEVVTATPAFALPTPDAASLFRQACADERTVRVLSRLVRLTGIERRHLAALDPAIAPGGPAPLYRPVGEQPHGPGMGARNGHFDRIAEGLVAQLLAGIPRDALEAVNVLVTATCTSASSPGLERPVFAHSPLRADVQRWNLGFMGCSAGLAALRLVQGLTGAARSALIVACELSSLHFQYSEAIDQLTANALFADGAAGLLVSTKPGRVRVLGARCVTLPARADQMLWFADDHGLRLELSPDLPQTLAGALPQAVRSLLHEHGLESPQIEHWLVHPGGPQILDCVEQSLDLGTNALHLSRRVLRDYGNMSSPTVFFILQDLLAHGGAGKCVMMGFGPGLTIELLLLEITRA